MKKVYLLMSRSIVSGVEHILGVFSSRKKANETMDKFFKTDEQSYTIEKGR